MTSGGRPRARLPVGADAEERRQDRAGGMAADVNATRIAAVAVDVFRQPRDGEFDVRHLRRIHVRHESVAHHRGDDALRSQRRRHVPVLPSIALAKSSAVNEEEYGCLSWRLGREVQIEPLLRVRPVGEVQRVRQRPASRIGQRPWPFRKRRAS